MAINMPAFKTLSLARIDADAEATKSARLKNSIMGFQESEYQRANKNREEIARVQQFYDNAGDVIAQLESDGNFEAADQVRQTAIAGYKGTLDLVESMKTWVNEENYSQVRGDLVRQGVVDPDDMPVKYSGSYFDRVARKMKNSLDVLTIRSPGKDGRTMAEDILVDEYGTEISRGGKYETDASRKARTGGDKGSGGFDFKSADANTIARQAAQMYGGFYDPVTQQFSGLDKELSAKVQALAEEAEKVYIENSGQIGHNEAVARAARRIQIDVSNIRDKFHNDPLGLRGQ